jgi:hypothetical protein
VGQQADAGLLGRRATKRTKRRRRKKKLENKEEQEKKHWKKLRKVPLDRLQAMDKSSQQVKGRILKQ